MIQKKNKDINKKCYALRNCIQILKKEEELYKNQLKNIKKKEQQDRIIQNDKIKIKIELKKIKIEKNKELMQKKERIQRFKLKAKNRLEEKKNENLSQKKRKYQSALNDKYLMKCIIEQINTQQNNKNCYNHAKVKQQINEFETNRMKQHMIKENKEKIEHENNLKVLKVIEKKMVDACNELELMEKKCLESLNKTKYYNIRYLENSSDSKSKYYFSHTKLIPFRHLNGSMELEINNDDKKLNHSILSPSVQSQKQNDVKDKFNNITFTQSSSVSNFRNKRAKNNIKNNSYTKRNNKSIIEKKNKNRTFINNDDKKKEKKITNNENKKNIQEEDKNNHLKNNSKIQKSTKVIKIKKKQK